MMSKTQLLDLPNELLLFIFQYLKSSNLIQAFFEVQSSRIQALIRPFLYHLDISEETDQWVQTYLPHLFLQQTIIALRLQDKHLDFISKDLFSNNLQSMHILSSDWITDLLKEGLDHLCQRLKQLTITFTYPHGKGDIAGHLFQSDSQLEYLNVTGRFLYFEANEIDTCSQLTYLSIELEGMHRVFILIDHLPKLQELKVKFRSEDRMVQPPYSIERECSNNSLRRVSFTGCTKYFDHLENFFAVFGSTIEYFSMNIDLMYYIIDGKRLERELLNKMPCLSSLNLIIHSTATYCDPLDIKTFQSATWEKFNPIVYCHDVHAHQHTLFTLPYKFDRFKHLSNNCISSWISNRSVSLCFERVQTVSLIPTTPFSLETFQFIQTNFPNIKTLEVTHPVKFPEIDQDDDQNRTISYMNDDLLSNFTFQLPSITKFCFLPSSHSDDYRIFRRFLHLLPNLTSLQMYIGRSLFRHILLDEEKSTQNALSRIQLLQMVRFYDEKNVSTNEEIHSLFPNAQILFDYDET